MKTLDAAKSYVKSHRAEITLVVITSVVSSAVTAAVMYDPEDYFTSVKKNDDGTLTLWTKSGKKYMTPN